MVRKLYLRLQSHGRNPVEEESVVDDQLEDYLVKGPLKADFSEHNLDFYLPTLQSSHTVD